MATYGDLRRFGLALPGVVERMHMRDQPSLRAYGRIFALWWEPERTTILKLDRGHQDFLFDVRPDVFAPCKVGQGVWSYVELSVLTRAELRSLVREAWSQVVPGKLRERVTSSAAEAPPRRSRSKAAARTRE